MSRFLRAVAGVVVAFVKRDLHRYRHGGVFGSHRCLDDPWRTVACSCGRVFWTYEPRKDVR